LNLLLAGAEIIVCDYIPVGSFIVLNLREETKNKKEYTTRLEKSNLSHLQLWKSSKHRIF